MKAYILQIKNISGYASFHYNSDGTLLRCEIRFEEIEIGHLRYIMRISGVLDELISGIKGSKTGQLREYTPDVKFEDFYIEYGYKVGKDEAKKAWVKHTTENQWLAKEYIFNYNQQLRLSGAAKKHPATYLNQMPWND